MAKRKVVKRTVYANSPSAWHHRDLVGKKVVFQTDTWKIRDELTAMLVAQVDFNSDTEEVRIFKHFNEI